jgi:hypothetical protein
MIAKFRILAILSGLIQLTIVQAVITITSTAATITAVETVFTTQTQVANTPSFNGPSLPSTISKLASFKPTGSTSVVTAYLDITSPDAVYGSVISANPSGTTYEIYCPLYPNCGTVTGNRNITISTNSAYGATEIGPGYTVSSNCTVTAGNAICYYGYGGDTPADATGDLAPTSSYETLPLSSLTPYEITVVDGLSKLGGATTAAGGSGAKSSSGSAKQTGSTGGAVRDGTGILIPFLLFSLTTLANL